MTQNYDVVIVGAGVIGLSVAYYLKRQGIERVLVLEKAKSWNTGSTALANGGIRQQFASPINIRLSQLSVPVFENFDQEFDTQIHFRQYGYLFVTATAEGEKNLCANLALQQQHGVPAEWLTPEQIAQLAPYVRLDDIIGGTFCGKDGYADSWSVGTGFGTAARNLGAEIEFEQEVTELLVSAGRVQGVKTNTREVHTNTVVNAAGPWAAKLAALAGVNLPVLPVRHMVLLTEELHTLPEKMPMTIDVDTGFIMRMEGHRCYMGWADPEEVPGFNLSFDPDWIDKTMERAVLRVPALEEAQVNPKRCAAGLFEVAPDHTCILGEAPQVQGFYLANGFSGHGMLHAPAAGMLTADLIAVNGGRTIWWTSHAPPLAVEEGKAVKETVVM
ncbi:MAG: FAD-dependent oxidoreductase [Blastocatellia bacterium]